MLSEILEQKRRPFRVSSWCFSMLLLISNCFACSNILACPHKSRHQDPLECFLSWNAWKGMVPPWCPTGNFSSLCWNSVGHCRMSQAIHLLCSEVSSCSKQNLGLLTTPQTTDPASLVQVAQFLGVNPDFYTQVGSLHVLNVGKSGRHQKQMLCEDSETTIRQVLKEIFHQEYQQMAQLLQSFQLVQGSAEWILRARDWSCERSGVSAAALARSWK